MNIALTALVTALALAVEHYFPWRLVLGRALPRIPAYILGMAAVAVPVSVLFLLWNAYLEIAALWAAIVAGGLTVMICYALDRYLALQARASEAEEREDQLKKTIKNG